MAPDQEAFRRTLRLALAMALGLTFAEARDQPFAFLTALLAVQMLTRLPQAPTLRQGLGFAVVMAAASGLALLLCALLLDRPVAYLLLLSVIFFGCFSLLASGRGGPLPQLLLLCNVTIPVLAVQSRDLAVDFGAVMIDASLTAPLLVWLVHAVLPTASPIAADAQPAKALAPTRAIQSTLVPLIILILPFAYFMLHPEEASFVILVTIIGIVGQPADARGPVVVGLLLGNLIGGTAASIAYLAVTLMPWLGMLFLTTLAAGLILGGRLHSGAKLAPAFGFALPAFLILLGLGLSPIGDGSAVAFASRLFDVALASLYALGAIVLCAGASRSPGAVRA